MKIKRALISVSDKTGLEGFVKGLNEAGVDIVSTGGTAKLISSLGIPVTEVASYTGFPEMMDGRVKTLHPTIHAGLLAVRDNPEHMKALKDNNIPTIDMVVVNLYPFEETISKKDVTLEEAIENIDIGGPTMLRSAAKNYRSVAVVSSHDQYKEVLEDMKRTGGGVSDELLKRLAIQVFANTSKYDGMITKYLSKRQEAKNQRGKEDDLPDKLDIKLEKLMSLRYGENPHQRGAFYRDVTDARPGLADAVQAQGKELSFNNILDLNAALEMAMSFDGPAVSIVKHNNPCGLAVADDLEQAYLDALDCDPMSAFGGIIGFNGIVSEKIARTILDKGHFVECIIAPGYECAALEAFKEKKNLRVIKSPAAYENSSAGKDIKKIPGGALVQDTDSVEISREDLKVVTKTSPSEDVMEALFFAWKTVKFVKSNAIVLCEGTKTVGIGAGQMSRVDSVIIAVRKAGAKAKGAVLASDAFFPKADSIEEAHKAGISAIIQPGGSIRDDEVIEACDKLGIPMVFTSRRNFKH